MNAQETITDFLEAWCERDYPRMYDLCQLTWKDDKSLKDLKELITVNISSFKILEVNYSVPTMKDFNITVNGDQRKLTCRLIKEKEPYKASESGTWGLNPVSVIKGLY